MQRMTRLDLACLAITEASTGGKVVGVIGDHDFLTQEVSHGGSILHKQLKDIISPKMEEFSEVDAEDLADRCLDEMVEANTSYAVVRDRMRGVSGVLSIEDLFRAVKEKKAPEIDILTMVAVDRQFGLM